MLYAYEEDFKCCPRNKKCPSPLEKNTGLFEWMSTYLLEEQCEVLIVADRWSWS